MNEKVVGGGWCTHKHYNVAPKVIALIARHNNAKTICLEELEYLHYQ